MKKYRIAERLYSFQDPYVKHLFETVPSYLVQVRKFFGWITVKEFF